MSSTPPLDALGLLDVYGPEELNEGDLVKVAGKGESHDAVYQVLRVTGPLVHLSGGKEFNFQTARTSRLVMLWNGSLDDLISEVTVLIGRANTLRNAAQFRPQHLGRAYLNLLRLVTDAEPMLEESYATTRRLARLLNRWFEENKPELWARGTPAPEIFIGRHDKNESWFGIRHGKWNELAAAARITANYAAFLGNAAGFLIKPKARNPAVGPQRQRCIIVDIPKLKEVIL
jgi:hypothetical protein